MKRKEIVTGFHCRKTLTNSSLPHDNSLKMDGRMISNFEAPDPSETVDDG